MRQHYEVVKPFTAAGKDLARGQVVDPTGWRNLAQIIDQGKLRPVYVEDPKPENKRGK